MTSKERAYLIKEGSKLNPIFQFGKAGINPQLTGAIKDALDARASLRFISAQQEKQSRQGQRRQDAPRPDVSLF